jgi:hypothetical protein
MADTKCLACGKILRGPAFYCDGCGGYYCYDDKVACGDMKFCCLNCANEMQVVTF